jgi:hypothetical protein
MERARLATAAGLASRHDDTAVEVGRRIEVEARKALGDDRARGAGAVEIQAAPAEQSPPGRHVRTETFVDRIRAALAAA